VNWEAIERLRGAEVHVVGLASTEGAAMVRFLWWEGVRRLTAHDFQPEDGVEIAFRRMHVGMPRDERDRVWSELTALPIERRLGDTYLGGIESADAVFAGQAWYLYPPNLPRLADLQARGVPFHSLSELYFGLWPSPILAVTGSNGKSTTSRLVETMLRQTGRPIYYAGNERRSVQVLDRIHEAEEGAWLVLEVSNRQLIDLRPEPRIGVVTNVLPNHLDEHGGSMTEYAAVKRRLLQNQGPDDIGVLNADNAVSCDLAANLPGRVFWFGRRGRQIGAWIEGGSIRVRIREDEPAMDVGPVPARHLPGRHNVENALAASLAAALAGADARAIGQGLEQFRGLRHRIQFVWAADGIEYYDDLNATTPEATLAALLALDPPIVLIAGGGDKGLDLGELAATIGERVTRLILLPGEGSDRLEAEVGACDSAPAVSRVDTLPEAVDAAAEVARPGDRVLLSPACPYFFRMHYLDEQGREIGFRKLLRRRAAQPKRHTEDAS
jgi:UDP-N-acetylmuramoylalanine--D-glutamate ligase